MCAGTESNRLNQLSQASQLMTLKSHSHKHFTVSVFIYWINDIQTQMLDWTYHFMIYLYTQ